MVKSTLSKAVALAVLGASTAAAECTFTWPAQSGDTCASMADLWGISVANFISYNPSVGANCANGVVVGTEYCVEWDFGQTPVTTSSSSTTSKVTSTSTSTSTIRVTSTTTTAPSGPSPTQDGIAANCNKYYKVVSGDYCQKIADGNGITLANFYAWNPAVGTSCGSLWVDYYVCVGVTGSTPVTTTTATTTAAPAGPSPTQSGLAANCNKYYKVVSGDYCQKIADGNGITLANFYAWNPAVGSSCGSLWVDYYVCVGVTGSTPVTTKTTSTAPAGPSPTQAGIPSTCKTFYKAVSGDYCQKIADAYKITLAQFYSWNPAVGTSCGSLWVDYYYCVAN